jgi:hypothetical protein
MNPYFFEIVRARHDRYSWQLVTYLDGGRDVVARTDADWGSYHDACQAAEATRNAIGTAPVVPAPLRPGDVRFEVVKDVLALHVTGAGKADGNGHHRLETTGADPTALTTGSAPSSRDKRDARDAAKDKDNGKTKDKNKGKRKGRGAADGATGTPSPRKSAAKSEASAAGS